MSAADVAAGVICGLSLATLLLAPPWHTLADRWQRLSNRVDNLADPGREWPPRDVHGRELQTGQTYVVDGNEWWPVDEWAERRG